MYGRIVYTTTTADTPAMSPFAAADIFALADVFVTLVPLGSVQDLFMYWGYADLEPYYDDQRSVSKSAAGVVEVTNFGSTAGFTFSIDNVVQDRSVQANEYAILQALNNELMLGTPMTWYPDYTHAPTEYYSCVAKKRITPKRLQNLPLWKFDFDFMILAAVQIPSTVPSFVLA